MIIVDQEELLGSLIPNVNISKILLETSGDTLIVDNPHIDNSAENFSLLEEKDKTEKSLKITLNLVVKEKGINENVLNWFDKSNLIKYLDIKIFQSTEKNLTDIFSSGNDMLDLADPSKNVPYDDIRYIYAAYVYGIDDVELINEKIRSNSHFKKITLNKTINSSNLINEFKSYIDDEGNHFYDITYTTSFILPHEKPEHLAYFVQCAFNLQELSKDFNIKLSANNLQNIPSKISSDIVIDDGQTVSKTHIFYDRSGKIWTGPVIQAENNTWYTGYELKENSKPLVRSVVVNTKVQDNRNFKKLHVNTNNVLNKYLNSSFSKVTKDNTIGTLKEAYFSNLFLSRGNDGDSKFIFAVNINKLINEKSIYGSLIKISKKIADEILLNSRITSLSIYRQRVKQDGVKYNIFDTNEPIDYILSTRDDNPGQLISINNDNCSLRESFIATNNQNQQIRYFTGIDKKMSEINTGLYQYIVELEIEDGTIDFVQKQIEILLLAKLELEKYHELSITPGVSRYNLEIQEPHIEHEKETISSKKYTQPYYDIISNQFTQEFDKLMKEKYSTENLLLAPWISSVSSYLTVLDLFTDLIDNVVERQKYVKDLYNAISPSTGNPNGIKTVIYLIDNLINILSKAINVSTTMSARKYGNSSQKISSFSKSHRETIKVKKIFSEVFDSDLSKDFIYDYLSNGVDDVENDDGIRIMTGEQFNKRIQNELLKHFDSTDESININFIENNLLLNDSLENSSFSYLSPTRIDSNTKSYVISKQVEQQLVKSPNKQNVIKKIKKKKFRNIEYVQNLQDKQNRMLEIKSEIINSSINGFSTNLSKKRNPKKTFKTKTSKIDYQNEESLENVDQNYLSILSMLSGATFEKNLINQRGISRVEIKENKKNNKNSNIISKDNIDSNVEYEFIFTKNNRHQLFDQLVEHIARYKKFDKKFIKKFGYLNSDRFRMSAQNILNLKSADLQARKNEIGEVLIDGFNKPLTSEEFKRLPNIYKQLFTRQKKNNKGLTNLKPTAVDQFDYGMLNQIEYLDSFEVNDFNDTSLNSPLWKILTKKEYESKEGKELLCRMRSYEDSNVGINKVSGLNKSFYDEMFILIPQNIQVEPYELKPVNIKNKKVMQNIVSSIEKAIPGIKFVEVSTKNNVSRRQPDRSLIYREANMQSVVAQRPLSALIVEQNIQQTQTPIAQIMSEPIPVVLPEVKNIDRKIIRRDIKNVDNKIKLLPNFISTSAENVITSTITMIEEDSSGKKISKRFELTDKSSIINSIESVNKNINLNINSVNIKTPIKIASELVALQSQKLFVKEEFTSNNQLVNKKFKDSIKKMINN